MIIDPNTCLQEMKEIVDRYSKGLPADLERVADLVEALDGWITGGGYLPTDWQTETEENA